MIQARNWCWEMEKVLSTEAVQLTTEMFSFSSDFFDFFDFLLPFSFFFSPFSTIGLPGESWIDAVADELSIDLLLVTDSCWSAWCSTTWCCSTTSTEPLLNEFSKLAAFDDVTDEDSVVETVLPFFVVVVLLDFTDFLTDFLTTVVSDSRLSTADYVDWYWANEGEKQRIMKIVSDFNDDYVHRVLCTRHERLVTSHMWFCESLSLIFIRELIHV